MKFKDFVTCFVFVFFIAATSVQAQFDFTGAVSGRVLSPNGEIVRRARVNILNLQTSETKTTITNNFGYFRIEGLSLFDSFFANAKTKRSSFMYSGVIFYFTSAEQEIILISDK